MQMVYVMHLVQVMVTMAQAHRCHLRLETHHLHHPLQKQLWDIMLVVEGMKLQLIPKTFVLVQQWLVQVEEATLRSLQTRKIFALDSTVLLGVQAQEMGHQS